MNKTTEQEWQQLEDRIHQFATRLLNEDLSVENRSNSILLVSESDLEENNTEDFL
ncbi:MAG: hypothetical protein ABFD50_14635 [Smithella sp.]